MISRQRQLRRAHLANQTRSNAHFCIDQVYIKSISSVASASFAIFAELLLLLLIASPRHFCCTDSNLIESSTHTRRSHPFPFDLMWAECVSSVCMCCVCVSFVHFAWWLRLIRIDARIAHDCNAQSMLFHCGPNRIVSYGRTQAHSLHLQQPDGILVIFPFLRADLFNCNHFTGRFSVVFLAARSKYDRRCRCLGAHIILHWAFFGIKESSNEERRKIKMWKFHYSPRAQVSKLLVPTSHGIFHASQTANGLNWNAIRRALCTRRRARASSENIQHALKLLEIGLTFDSQDLELTETKCKQKSGTAKNRKQLYQLPNEYMNLSVIWSDFFCQHT